MSTYYPSALTLDELDGEWRMVASSHRPGYWDWLLSEFERHELLRNLLVTGKVATVQVRGERGEYCLLAGTVPKKHQARMAMPQWWDASA